MVNNRSTNLFLSLLTILVFFVPYLLIALTGLFILNYKFTSLIFEILEDNKNKNNIKNFEVGQFIFVLLIFILILLLNYCFLLSHKIKL
jgi:hypothetical protein